MAWVDLPDPAEAEGDLAAAFAAGEAVYGQVLEAWKAVSLVDGAFPAYLPYLRAVVGPGAVEVRIKDLAALRVAVLLRCRYTISHRVASARRNGIDEAAIAAMADPAAHDLDAPLAAAVALAESMTLGLPDAAFRDAPQGIDADVLAACRAVFDDAQLAELTLSISLWNALTRFHRVMALDLDMPAPPPGLEPR